MEPFQVVHRFRTLAERGYITPLACAMCYQELVTRLGKDDEPVAHCYTCGYTSNVSMATILFMEHAISNYERGRV